LKTQEFPQDFNPGTWCGSKLWQGPYGTKTDEDLVDKTVGVIVKLEQEKS
jgi:hypothetical protein